MTQDLPAALNHQRLAKPHWAAAKAWHTNVALGFVGIAMFVLARQLVSENDFFTIGFSGVSGWSVIVYVVACWLILTQPVNRWTMPIILTVAIVCRLVTLFPEPFLSSDVYRYAWDGVVQHAHISPYRYVPGNPALTFLRAPNQDLFDNMNRRDYAVTIYPPVAQIIFYLVTWISPTVTFMKMAMILFEGVTVWGLIQLLRELGLPPQRSLLYAWCPLLIWEIGGSGHLDSAVMAFVVLAILARSRRQNVLTGLFLGLAVFTKFYPLVLVPALYRRGDWKMPAVIAAIGLGSYSIYLSAGKLVFGFLGGYVQEEGMATGARYFLLELANNLPGLHNLSKHGFLTFAAVVFLSLMVWAWNTGCRRESARWAFLPPGLALGLALMLLFSPHYPWYAAWLVPFVVLMPRWTLATYFLGLFYLCTTELAVGYGPEQYQLNERLYGAVALAFLLEVIFFGIPVTRAWLLRLIPDPILAQQRMPSQNR